MELDELKNTWTVLDEQLKKNETLNRNILQEMLYKKSNRALNKLVNHDLFRVILLLSFIPFCIWLYNSLYFRIMFSVKILSITCIVFSVMTLILYYYKLKYLMKTDFSKSVKENMYCINKYEIMVKREKIASYILTPIMSLLVAFCYYEFKVGLFSWTFLSVWIAIGVVVSVWIFKRIYDINIQSIKRSLEELEELKEE